MTTSRCIDAQPKRVGTLTSVESVVTDFIARWREPARKEQRWFATQPSLKAAIKTAGMAIGREGKMSHQWRIPTDALKEWTKELLENASAIRDASTFEELHDVVAACGRRVHGIGILTVYDTANRIGGFLGLHPERVYVHAGVRDGAKPFHPANRNWMSMSELPRAFRRLSPSETEDCLCIYKRQLAAIARRSPSVLSIPRGC